MVFAMNKKGITLIELAVSLSIASVLLTLAYVGFSSMVKRERVRSASFNISSAFELGKMIAVKKGKEVCLSVDVNGDGNKDSGYCLYINKDNNIKVSSGDKIIEKKIFKNVEYDFAKTSVDNNPTVAKPIRFRPQGSVLGGTIALKAVGGGIKKISIDLIGKVRIKNE
ncbi:MAG: hypothetical protein CSA18_03355 [Deltaproteobacteria bacterium]|nr:MAG: hypothetical protein CSA18_03355 [Deltaproteobacteria bacterium]